MKNKSKIMAFPIAVQILVEGEHEHESVNAMK